jgi:hypothetical protein
LKSCLSHSYKQSAIFVRSVRMTTHSTSLVSARDHWWTLEFANAFVFLGVNSRGELAPSHQRLVQDQYRVRGVGLLQFGRHGVSYKVGIGGQWYFLVFFVI